MVEKVISNELIEKINSTKLKNLATHLIVYKNIPDDDGTHTEFHFDRRSFGVTNL